MNRILSIYQITARIACILFVAVPLLVGHDPGMSNATATVNGRIVKLLVSLPVEDAARFSKASAGALDPSPMLLEVNGAVVEPARISAQSLSDEVRYDLEYSLDSAPDAILLRSSAVNYLPAGHRQFVSVRGSSGEPLASCLLSQDENTCLAVTSGGGASDVGEAGVVGFAKFIWLLIAASVVFVLRYGIRRAASPQQATTIVTMLALSAAPILAESKSAVEPEPLHFSVSVTATALDSKIDLHDAESFRNTLFSRDDQLFSLLGGGINAGQHEGGGKSVEIRRFGYNLDHGGAGGGLRVVVDGVVQNQSTQGHGQGYLGALKSLSPELIDEVGLIDGPFSAEHGDFSGLGVVQIQLRESLPDVWTAKFQYGSFGSTRRFLSWSPRAANRDAFIAYDGSRADGPFLWPLDYSRHNVTGNYGWRLGDNRKFGVRWNGGTNSFNSSGQIPIDQVAAGRLDRFGAVGESDGGAVQQGRIGVHYRDDFSDGSTFKATAYVDRSLFDLYSNFTFFLNDPVRGDGIQQHDSRLSEGASAQYTRPTLHDWGVSTLTVGGNWLATQTSVGLWRQAGRDPFANVTSDAASLMNSGAFLNDQFSLANGRFEFGIGLRVDTFRYQLLGSTDPDEALRSVSMKLQPKGNVVFHARDGLEFFANYGRGVSSLDARGISRHPDSPHVAHTDFVQYGARYMLCGRASLRASMFSIRNSNQIVYVPDDGTVEFAGASQSYGFEAKLSAPIAHRVSFDGGITKVLNGYYRDSEPRIYLDRAPRFTANATITARNIRGWTGALRIRAINHYPLDGSDLSILASGHTLADLSLSRPVRPGLDLSLTVDNLFNRRYWETQNYFESSLAGAAPTNRIHGTPGYGRAIVIGMAIRLGKM